MDSGAVDAAVAAELGITLPTDSAAARGALVEFIGASRRREARAVWERLQSVYLLLQSVLADTPGHTVGARDSATTDGYLLTAQRIQAGLSISSGAAQQMVGDAIAAVTRIPECASLLKDGVVSGPMFSVLVSRTLNVLDPQVLAAIDAEIATELRGSVSVSRYRVQVTADRIVDTHDADAVRENRQAARRSRYVAVTDADDGMALLQVLAAAEDTRIALAAIDALIGGVCANDPRTKNQRRVDAVIARLTGAPFTCGCGEEVTCTASLDQGAVSARQARMVVHVICRRSTIDGGTVPGFIDGYGVISADHVRDLTRRPDAVVRELCLDDVLTFDGQESASDRDPPTSGAAASDKDRTDVSKLEEARPLMPLAATSQPTIIAVGACALPGDGYRPSTTTDTIARFLFGTCTVPGCTKAAYACDLDHVTEYDHFLPVDGGPTCLCNLNPKCRSHHRLKTFGSGWIDDQYHDETGRTITSWTTPDGQCAETLALNHWLFPELDHATCAHTRDSPVVAMLEPNRYRNRTADKHARRRAERRRQRQIRNTAAANANSTESEDGRTIDHGINAGFVDFGPPPF